MISILPYPVRFDDEPGGYTLSNGSAAYNGDYILTGTHEGKGYFLKEDGLRDIRWFGNAWWVAAVATRDFELGDDAYAYKVDAGTTPPLSGWTWVDITLTPI